MSDEGSDVEYSLVIPFLPVVSKGGPFEDEAYVAGYQMGVLESQMDGEGDFSVTVDARNVAQADLIAMRNSYVTEAVQAQDGWVELEFKYKT